MEKWKSTQRLSILLIFISLIVLVWLSSNIWMQVFLVILFVNLIIWRWADLKIRAKSDRVEMEKAENKLITILNHYRHDWLNDLQLIFGYVKLKKYDNLEGYVDKIKDKLEQESVIARLDVPSLTLDLISFRHSNHTFNLKLEMEQGLQLSKEPVLTEAISEVIMETLRVFQDAAHMSSEKTNDLCIHMNSEEKALILVFKYSGDYFSEKFELAVKEKLKRLELGNQVEWVSDVEKMNAFVKITVPVQT
jgi:stage 0 sporulation protein B (sporulation initiation phosphotransferase)